MKLADYAKAKKFQYGKDENILKNLTQLEREMSDLHLLVKIKGKCNSKLHLLLPNYVEEVLDVLIADRELIGISPTNVYVYPGTKETYKEPWPVLDRFSKKYDLGTIHILPENRCAGWVDSDIDNFLTCLTSVL